jgi:hypothetical protein
MNAPRAPRDPDTVVATWLDEGPTDLPEETGHAIVVAARTMPQGRGRFDRLGRAVATMRFDALGLVASVAIVAVVGLAALASFRVGGPGASGLPPSVSPAPSATVPPLTQPFTSPWYGYSIRNPEGWEAIPATSFLDLTEFAANEGPSEWMDVIHPLTTDGLFRAGSAVIPPGVNLEAWIRQYTDCTIECLAGLEAITIDGQPARLHRQDGDSTFEASVVAGDRVYLFTLFTGQGGEEPGLEDGRALFDAMMATVELHPDDAVEAPIAPSSP